MKITGVLLGVVCVTAIGGAACVGAVPSTLGVQPGDAGLASCPPSPNCVSSRAADAGHSVEPIQIAGDVAAGWTQIQEALASMPRVRIVTQSESYAHAESTSLLMRYVDDLELLLDPATGRVDVRSASRRGHGDMGANAARVELLRGLIAARGVTAN